MGLKDIEVSWFRNLDKVSITPHPTFNLIVGDNGSGKTSLLEAIYYLGRGRSFKTPNGDKLIQYGADAFMLFARLSSDDAEERIGARRTHGSSQIRLTGQTVQRASQLIEALPVQLIEPGIQAFFEQGPDIRRRFLEWGVFHVEPGYGHAWRNYKRSLLQRNAALKTGLKTDQITHWDEQLVASAEIIDLHRRDYLERVREALEEYLGFFKALRPGSISLDYYQGWKAGTTFADSLIAAYVSDRERGFTQCGPHRADIRVRVGANSAKDILSRGEQKLFVSLLFVVQGVLLKQETGKAGVILVDDLAAELDQYNRTNLTEILASSQSQVYLTATSQSILGGLCEYIPHHLFHVKHGGIQQVV